MINSIEKKVLDKISNDHIAPSPKWHFVLKVVLLWGSFMLLAIVGSLSVAASIFLLKNNDWDIYRMAEKNYLYYSLKTLPYFWIVLIFIFAAAAIYNFKHTEKGYKYNLGILVVLSFALSLLAGAGLYAFGLGEKAEFGAASAVPFYKDLDHSRMMAVWSHPEGGLLAGEIITSKDNEFKLLDLQRQEWRVTHNMLLVNDFYEPEIGMRVKVVGSKIGDFKFRAVEIRPLRVMNFNHMHKHMMHRMYEKK